jgi:hypothetical protein
MFSLTLPVLTKIKNVNEPFRSTFREYSTDQTASYYLTSGATFEPVGVLVAKTRKGQEEVNATFLTPVLLPKSKII